MRHERYAPFPIVNSSGTCNQLRNATRKLSTNSSMSAHQSFSRREIQRIPIVVPFAPFAHRIESHYLPVRHFRVEPIMLVFSHSVPNLSHALFELFAA